MDLFTDLFRQNLFSQMGYSVLAVSLVLVRILAFMHFAPIFSNKSVPAHVRIGMSFLLTMMLAPRALAEEIPAEGYSLLFAILTNFILGFIMGFTANVLFSTVMAGGEMMDASMGFSAGQIFDAGLNSQTTIIGKFMSILSAVVFFYIGGPEILLQGIGDSMSTFSIYMNSVDINVFKIAHLCGNIITMGFILVSPVVITILINDIVLGLVSRASPQINAFQISFTVKPTIGVTILMLILPLFFTALINFFSHVKSLY